MSAGWDQMIVAAPLDDISNGSAIYLQVGGKVPAEIRRSDHNQTATRLSRSVAERNSGEKDKNQKKSADAG
jgi:hypothetical protein